ncbi:cytochrome-c peroxidase [Crenothrix polyspora]|uniref:CorB n=1 Tax=Crenothrix polyspora TaxID=360316 RepID=A0A1R4H3N4_9GAMM|nr:cytochrome c peroxidase [Crenothrix polyspora]SJM90459.1 CorB [Crenothrix polyspora]
MDNRQHFTILSKPFFSLILPGGVFLLTVLVSNKVSALGNTPPSLKGVAIPVTPGLLNGKTPIVINKTAAIALGKALFWDSAVGSDGMACASCHFHAGADRRVTNQLETGSLHKTATGKTFQKTASGGLGGVNYTLKRSDFPLYKLADPAKKDAKVLFSTDDVVTSSGVFLNRFKGLNVNSSLVDDCISIKDAVFHSGAVNTRQTLPRQAPSVINAAFNFRNFWDGRANNIFNGVSAFGARDSKAGVWIMSNGKARKQTLRLANASLASQAVAPVLSNTEMSCAQRSFPDVGRKLLSYRPLATQEIHAEDSVLGGLRQTSGKGLIASYQDLIKAAFAPRYWSGNGDFGRPVAKNAQPYNQMEANFSLFFGLALQLYQQTLISDQSPFDSPRVPGENPQFPEDLTTPQARGLRVFMSSNCINCHKGATLSSAAHPDLFNPAFAYTSLRLVNRKTFTGGLSGDPVVLGLMDEGYFNTSVTPDNHDLGIGGRDPFGNPLSFVQQYVQKLLTGKSLNDPIIINSCDMDGLFLNEYVSTELRKDPYISGSCGTRAFYAQIPKVAVLQAELKKGKLARDIVAVNGAFKTPTLRNVELTGPYMHNGSLLTLEQVVDFYFRGGNVSNAAHPARLLTARPITPEDKADLVAFLKSLTDERVRFERAPFDHPQLRIPHGHSTRVDPKNTKQAEDLFLTLPAIGKKGRDAKLGPLKAFETYLKP